MQLEIHFHQQVKASIFLESNIKKSNENYAHILMLASYIYRTIYNLDEKPASELAWLLNEININGKDYLKNMINNYSPNEPKLVEYKGNQGRKSFTADLSYKNRNYIGDFRLYTNGFGFLGEGINYYSPSSVILLIRYLTKKYLKQNQGDFLIKICDCLKLCFQAY